MPVVNKIKYAFIIALELIHRYSTGLPKPTIFLGGASITTMFGGMGALVGGLISTDST